MLEAPIHFPEEAKVPETKVHLDLRTALYQILQSAFGRQAWIGCDQFVYWKPRDPRRCLAPDGFVKLGGPDEPFPIWKVWERGTLDLAVEIVSNSDSRRWDEKLLDYREIGVRELVRFDPEAPEGERLDVWDRVDDKLVRRSVENDATPSRVLAGHRWVTGSLERVPVALRLVDGNGRWLPTPTERVAELEAELAKRGG